MENSSNVLENCRSPVSSNFNNKQAISCSSTSLNSSNEFVSRPASAASLYFNNNKQNLNSNVNHFSSGSLSTTSSVTALSSNDDQSFFASSKNRKRPVSKKNSSSITAFADRLSEKEEAEIHQSLAEFFYGCNIPLCVVESIYFKNLIKKLRPAYADKIPGRKALSTTLLDTAYEKCLTSAKETMGSEAVLLIDGWKNSSSNCKTVVSMLHNANGEQGFLEAWDVTCESETAEKLAEIVSESVKLAEKMYSTHVYAVVSDNASAMKKMGQLTSHLVWKSNCSSHTGNLLAKDIINKELNLKVTSVLKEFKHADLEKLIVEKGGKRMKLPCDTRWCSYRDAYQCLILNSQIMRQVAADSKVSAKSVGLLFDEVFMNEVKKYVLILDPICKLINECQSQKCSAADAVDTWLSLQLPAEYSTMLKNRQNMALNKYSLSAFYLHPFKDKAKLNNEHDDIIFEFLFQNLDGTGIEEWDHYRHKTGFFQTLFEKDIQKPLVFWNMAEMKYPTLTKFAKKLLQIPASSAQLERLFSSWAHVHSFKRNRLTFERSKKLLHVYYSLRFKDVSLENETDESDF